MLSNNLEHSCLLLESSYYSQQKFNHKILVPLLHRDTEHTSIFTIWSDNLLYKYNKGLNKTLWSPLL